MAYICRTAQLHSSKCNMTDCSGYQKSFLLHENHGHPWSMEALSGGLPFPGSSYSYVRNDLNSNHIKRYSSFLGALGLLRTGAYIQGVHVHLFKEKEGSSL